LKKEADRILLHSTPRS